MSYNVSKYSVYFYFIHSFYETIQTFTEIFEIDLKIKYINIANKYNAFISYAFNKMLTKLHFLYLVKINNKYFASGDQLNLFNVYYYAFK